jgi:hypothetical protein
VHDEGDGMQISNRAEHEGTLQLSRHLAAASAAVAAAAAEEEKEEEMEDM